MPGQWPARTHVYRRGKTQAPNTQSPKKRSAFAGGYGGERTGALQDAIAQHGTISILGGPCAFMWGAGKKRQIPSSNKVSNRLYSALFAFLWGNHFRWRRPAGPSLPGRREGNVTASRQQRPTEVGSNRLLSPYTAFLWESFLRGGKSSKKEGSTGRTISEGRRPSGPSLPSFGGRNVKCGGRNSKRVSYAYLRLSTLKYG
jgi:hypothetical protein